jgi:hypothetical protein
VDRSFGAQGHDVGRPMPAVALPGWLAGYVAEAAADRLPG